MKPPLRDRTLLHLPSTTSTQQLALSAVLQRSTDVGGVMADEQTAGRGRFGRSWISPKGRSLSLSLILWDYADWPAPHLLGMACGLACANACDCSIAWPNDLMQGGRKIGGVLTELFSDDDGRKIPVVGIGINLLPFEVPSELESVIGFLDFHGSPETLAKQISEQFARIPEPFEFSSLEEVWQRKDCTPGKMYRISEQRIGEAVAVTSTGHLKVSFGGELLEVPSAEAWFGPTQ
jgi:BirA family biotin operon repressor/biotin-[acetyl-CoA-carboxylase] ligase